MVRVSGGELAAAGLPASTARSLARGVSYLARLQHPQGSWTDFWLPVGTSDEWVTAYVGLALSAAAGSPLLDSPVRASAADHARRAARWLLRRQRPLGGWGYNATVPPDADSTAHALSLLSRVELDVTAEAVAFLRAHEVVGEGFRTYKWRDRDHQWTRPCADVTAAALRALHDVGALSQAALRAVWLETLGRSQDDRGWWSGYWWTSPNYTTGLALQVWNAAGRPPLAHPVSHALPAEDAFDLAGAILAYGFCEESGPRLPALVERLIARQEADGGWPSGLILRVPPSHALTGSSRQPTMARDARRLFTTATAVRALAFVGQRVTRFDIEDDGRGIVAATSLDALILPFDLPDGNGERAIVEDIPNPPSGPGSPAEGRGRRGGESERRRSARPATVGAFARRSTLGRALDDLVEQAARAVGFGAREAGEARDIFATLTWESLAEPCPWPAAQLSSLASGAPLEFSATVGRDVRPALRYAVEVGNPYLPPYERARSAIVGVARTAERLGYQAAWQRVAPAVDLLVAPALAVPDGLRFWVWSGVDQVAPTDEARSVPGLKIYLNLLNYEVGNTRQRVEATLAAAAIPRSRELGATLDLLDDAGFPHEIGFGLGPNGKIACKIYYELDGWRRSLVHRLLAIAGLPSETDALCPEIPGVLRESLAAKSRAGIALRIDPTSGAVRELTTAAAFPTPMIPHQETGRRVAAWIDANGWDATAYLALRMLLLPSWEGRRAMEGRLHSLFTRTISAEGAWATIYLRPHVE